VNAVQCAVELQNAMAAANADVCQDSWILLRVGINLGDVMVEGSDLYGDGVNIAGRLEALADPGSVVVSRTVFDHVRGKVKLGFDDLGEQQLKNIAEPVRIYRLRPDGKSAIARPALALPDMPSIVVLPFENMSGDPEQEYFADGLTENIITGLSRFRDLFVIARHSSFAYKRKAAKIPDVCRELGVRYVLEGSVQMSSGNVRIAAQFIDGMMDHHLWAERYDRKVEDIFVVQDDVTEMIVGTLATSYGGRLRKAWNARSEGSGPRDFRAIDYFHVGQDFLGHFTREDNIRACEFFTKAADLNAGYAKPCAKIAWSKIVDVMFGWSENPAASLAIALKSATEAIRRDDDEAWGHWALAAYYLYGLRQHDRAIAELQRALDLNPNEADVITDLGLFLSYAGRARDGLEWALKAMRLNPHYHDWYVMQLGQIYYDARCYEKAIAAFLSLSSVDTALIELYLAASYAALDRSPDAREAIKRALELDPRATIAQWTEPARAPYKETSDLEHFRDFLRKAGLPE
jgi:adenylate cyclase